MAAAWVASSAWAGAGEHVPIGDYTTFTPEITTGVEVRSNSFLSVGRQSASAGDQALPSMNFLLAPGLAFHVEHPKVRFDLGGTYELRKYFATALAERLDRFTDFGARARLDALPEGVVGFRLLDNASLRNRTSDNPFRPSALLTQLRNELSGGVVVRPGPDIDIELLGGWNFHNYRVPGAEGQFDFNTRNTGVAQLNVQWRFFPSTAFVFEGQYQGNRWKNHWIPRSAALSGNVDPAVVDPDDSYLAMPDSDFGKFMAGLRGRITRSLVLTVMAGWGVGRYDVDSVAPEAAANPGNFGEDNPDIDGWGQNVSGADGLLALVKADIDLGFTQRKALGQRIGLFYRKDFQDSFFTNYVAQNHIRLGLNSRWGKYLVSNVAAGPRFERYIGEAQDGRGQRRDIYWQVDFGLTVSPTAWFDISAGGFWVQRASNYRDLQYDNVQGHLLLHFQY